MKKLTSLLSVAVLGVWLVGCGESKTEPAGGGAAAPAAKASEEMKPAEPAAATPEAAATPAEGEKKAE